MKSSIISTTADSISSGGTITGDLTISGDLTVNGDGSGNYDEIVNGNLAISSTNKLVLGGDGSDTYLQESSADVLDIYVGAANMMKFTESSTDTLAIVSDDVTITGNVGIGDSSPDAHLDVQNDTVTAAADFTGIWSNHTKTAGASNASDNFRGMRSDITFNQGDAFFEQLIGIDVYAHAQSSAGDSSALYGAQIACQMAGSTDVNNVY